MVVAGVTVVVVPLAVVLVVAGAGAPGDGEQGDGERCVGIDCPHGGFLRNCRVCKLARKLGHPVRAMGGTGTNPWDGVRG